MKVTINQLCVCRRGKKDDFMRGEKYHVNYLYQNGDGDFMLNVESGLKWTVNCYAKRFVMPEVNVMM